MNRLSASPIRRALPLLGLLAVPVLTQIAEAQTIVTSPAAPAGTVAAVPAGPTRVALPVIVAAAIDTSGNEGNAKKALRAANYALGLTPGYAPASAKSYQALAGASLKNADWSFPFTATDYQKIGKVSKAAKVMTISVTPNSDGSFSAIAEMNDVKNGGLTGYGKGFSDAAEGALELAVRSAVVALGETATIPGIVISKPDGGLARLSLGTHSGARGGARVEYLGENDEPIAFGTIIDIAAGESVATVAPETAYPGLFVNQRIRLVSNPSESRALPTLSALQDKDYKAFERNFGFSLAVVGAVYFLTAPK
ncbi:hypothetical protein B1R32_10377 [Abditibacterium utsteinense]|uniref:Uncharacterized protein n=1 Tax=Abditibacterium utsteinense TaxID=1960156 RepID=A0A2S8SVJ6_9BACT|nr:hypothetical protein [Abditibacterium utsteinense]PQV64810.1 hypothetical protein B1R32_10377 [Abditibacterium utsteinense]